MPRLNKTTNPTKKQKQTSSSIGTGSSTTNQAYANNINMPSGTSATVGGKKIQQLPLAGLA